MHQLLRSLPVLIDGVQAHAVRTPFADGSVHRLPEGVTDETALVPADVLPTSCPRPPRSVPSTAASGRATPIVVDPVGSGALEVAVLRG